MSRFWLLCLALGSISKLALGALPHVTCPRDYKKIGCVYQKNGANRDLLVNDRDVTSPKYQGYILNWREFDQSIHSLACRCKQSAAAGGYPYFSISFYGECYGTKESLNITALAGNPSSDCVGPTFKQCVNSDLQECVGKAFSEYMFEVGSGSKQETSVDGGYSEWSDWGFCSASCGTGQMSRERTCSNPVPSGAGKDCSYLGPSTEVKECNPTPCKPPVNLSLRKTATQSSLYLGSHPAHATNALDGNTNTDFEQKSCTHTNSEPNPWWQVDLDVPSFVKQVIIYNRIDCCSDRLNNVKVTVGNDVSGAEQNLCGGVQNMRGVAVTTVNCPEPLLGRYVRISIPSGYLTLCEVQVMGNPQEALINMAAGKAATQSSLYTVSYPADAKNAVDGNRETSFDSRSCTHTNLEDNPWWQVDLGQIGTVVKVIVSNRMDCCSERLNNFVVTVGNNPNGVGNTVCGGEANMREVAKKDIGCPVQTTGRYVRISVPRRDYLTLCEVEVMGYYYYPVDTTV